MRIVGWQFCSGGEDIWVVGLSWGGSIFGSLIKCSHSFSELFLIYLMNTWHMFKFFFTNI